MNTLHTSDGLRLHTAVWRPATDPKAVVLLVHGIGEHCGRYAHVAQHLNAHGFAVYSFDHRGHGQSEGMRVYFDNFQQAVDDMKRVADAVRSENPGKRLFLFGHSMGSLISTLFVLQHQDMLAGFISSGSPLALDQAVPGLVQLALRGLARIAPKWELVPLNPKTLISDSSAVEAFLNDPLVSTRPMRLGMLVGLADNAIAAREKLGTVHIPLLILHGTADTVTPPPGSSILYQKAGSADKTLKTYPGMYHELHNETDRAVVLQDIADWLNRQVQQS